MTSEIRSRGSIVGVGATPQGRHPDKSSNDLAVDAALSALDDAGISKDQVDGLITCKSLGGQGVDIQIGQMLGLNPSFSASLDYGTCNFSIHLASMAISAGLASTILMTYGTNQGTAFGDARFASYLLPDSIYGYIDGIGGMAAQMFQRHRQRYGVTEEQLGAISVAQRRWAALNPLAVRGTPISIDDYMSEPYYINPIRAYDVTPFDDGGGALIMTSADRAVDFPHRPVHVLGISQTAALRQFQIADHLDRPWITSVAARAGLRTK